MKEAMPVLALDPSTVTGWAISPLLSGIWDLNLKRDESIGMKFLRLRAKLNELYENYEIKLVVYEAARNAQPKMQGSLVHQAQLQAIIVDWAHTLGLDYKGYSPKEIKRWATKNGNASKELMVAAAKRFFPQVNIVNDDHADALCLWKMTTEEFRFLLEKPRSETPFTDGLRAAIAKEKAVVDRSATDGQSVPAPQSKAVPVPQSKAANGVPAKIERAFRKAGMAEVPASEKILFISKLNAAGIPFMKRAPGRISAGRIAQVLRGKKTIESLLAVRKGVANSSENAQQTKEKKQLPKDRLVTAAGDAVQL